MQQRINAPTTAMVVEKNKTEFDNVAMILFPPRNKTLPRKKKRAELTTLLITYKPICRDQCLYV